MLKPFQPVTHAGSTKVFVAEDARYFPLLPLLRLIGANMMVYVCFVKK